MGKKGVSIEKILVWLLTGIVISLSITAIIASGHVNLSCFYDVGEIYTITQSQTFYVFGVSYDTENKMYIAKDESCGRYIIVKDDQTKWQNLYFNARFDGYDEMPVRLEFYNDVGEMLKQFDAVVKEGENVIPLYGMNFYKANINIENHQGTAFFFDDIQLFERDPFSWGKDNYIWMTGIFLIYSVVSILFIRGKRTKQCKSGWYLCADGLQDCYCFAGNAILKHMVIKNEERGKIRTGLFTLLIVYVYVIYELGYYNDYYRYHVLFGMTVLIIIGLVSVEGELKKVDWNNSLVRYWGLFWIAAIVSDFVVQKKIYSYVGWVMLFGMSFFFFLWNQMERPQDMIRDMLNALEITFWVNLVVCILFRPVLEGARYTGTADNPGIYAMYMTVMIIMFAAKIEDAWLESVWNLRLIRCTVGLTAALLMLWKTQSMTSISASCFIAFLALGRIHLQRRSHKSRHTGKRVIVLIMAAGVTAILLSWGLTHVSASLHLDHIMPYELLYAGKLQSPFTLECYAASNRVVQKLQSVTNLETFTSGRNVFWAEYLRRMNLFGHPYKARFWGSVHWAHNGILWIGYYYGVLAVVPYTLLFLKGILESAKRIHIKVKHGAYEIVPFAMLTAISIISLADNVEQTFGLIVWYLQYIMLGILFMQGEKDAE